MAEDHAIVRDGLKLILQGEPDLVVVGEASDGLQALSLALELSPDVVVMDISMPRASGLIAARQIREQRPDTRVLMLTMHDRDDYLFECMRIGVLGYLLKETAAETLVDAIRKVVQGHWAIDPRFAEQVDPELFTHTAPRRHGDLTVRELEVLHLVADGLTNQDIAQSLCVSVKTVQTHRSHIMSKLNLHDRLDVLKYAMRHGIWTP